MPRGVASGPRARYIRRSMSRSPSPTGTARLERPTLAYLAWGLGTIAFAYAWLHRVMPSVMVDHLMADFAVGGAILGNLSAIYFYAYAGMQLPVGVVVDKWGARKPLAVALIAAAAGSALFGSAESVGPAYLGRLMIGAGCAFAFVATLKYATDRFPPKRLAMLSGAVLLIGLLGGVGGQAPTAMLIDAIGWRHCMYALAAAGVVLALLACLAFHDAPEPTGHDFGTDSRKLLAGLGAVLRRPQVWIVTLYGTAVAAPIFAFAALWGVPYLMQIYGLPREAAAAMTSAMLIGMGGGSFLFGWVSDRLGRRRPVMLAGAASAAVLMSLILYGPDLPPVAVAVLLFLCGLSGGAIVLSFVGAAEHGPPDASGAAISFANMMIIASGALTQPLVGLLLDLNWDGAMAAGARVYPPEAYAIAFAPLPALFAAGLLLALIFRERGSDVV